MPSQAQNTHQPHLGHDLIVYGGTAAGVLAAVASAREGLSTLLLEPGDHLGGMVSGGLGATDAGTPEAIGGLAREVFNRLGEHYGLDGPAWTHEPSAAEHVFREMLKEAGVNVRFRTRLHENQPPEKIETTLASITTQTGERLTAHQFIDATYEGDLMAAAGVSYRVGRDSIDAYNEPKSGIRPPVHFGVSAHDDHGLLPDIADEPYGDIGAADHRVMAYTYRLCLTRNPDNQIPFDKPHGYDRRRYSLLTHVLAKAPDARFLDMILPVDLPNGKIDANNRPGLIVSTNLHNGSWEYPEASWNRRDAIAHDHQTYVRGFFYFLANDHAVPPQLRSEAAQWGLAADEFTDTDGWPHQLYVRAGRRMIGEHVMTAHDMLTHTSKSDAVAMGSYFLDSHRCRRIVMPSGEVATEGGVGGETTPYDIPYRCITPLAAQATNLTVPVCLSSSSVAWCSLRMEPIFMALGHAAGLAAAIACRSDRPVQALDRAQLQQKLRENNQVINQSGLSAMREHQHQPLGAPQVTVRADTARQVLRDPRTSDTRQR
ncbi:MAG: FAD-dependent oxidoreductase [Phycisphaeraceae bacterium]